MPGYVFISYKAEEYREAKWIKDRLEAEGIRCWMAPASIPGGSNYAMEIPIAIRDCTAFIMVLSRQAQNSKWIPRELDRAINHDKRILPFCIDNYPLREHFSFYLSNVQCYKAWEDREGALRDMMVVIRELFAAVPSQPPSPHKRQDIPVKEISRKDASRKGKQAAAAVLVAAVILCILAAAVLKGMSGQDTEDGTLYEASAGETEIESLEDEESGDAVSGDTADENPGSDEQGNEDSASDEQDKEDPDPESTQEVTEQDETDPAAVVYNTRGTVRILNKKGDKEEEFKRLAWKFQEESGIRVSVESAGHSGYDTALENALSGGRNDATLFMLGGLGDFEKYGSKCMELSEIPAAMELDDDRYALTGSNGKIYGLAFIVESYGLAVNVRLLEKAGYRISDIQSFSDLKRVAKDITARKKELGFSAFTSPSVGASASGNYRLAEHAATVPLWYELQDNDFNIGMKLRGTYLNHYRDFIDLCLDNATVGRAEASSRSIDDARKEFLAGKAVFHQDGSWDTDEIRSILDDRAAVIPLYMGMPGEEEQGINETFTYFWCINKDAPQDDREATLQFLYWLVTSDTGIRAVTSDMGFVMPYRQAGIPDNLFLETLYDEIGRGLVPITQYYKYGDDKEWKKVLIAAIQNYADGTGNWKAVEEAFKTLW